MKMKQAMITFILLTLWLAANSFAWGGALKTNIGQDAIVKADVTEKESIQGSKSVVSTVKHVSGQVYGEWSSDTVYVDGDISIPLNQELVIKPNVYVYFSGAYKFDVYGTLTAKGEENDSIFFASDSLVEINDYPYYHGFWYGIVFHSTAENEQKASTLAYCNLKYAFYVWLDEMANRYGGGLVFYKSDVNVSNCSLYDCVEENITNGVFSAIHSSGAVNGLSFSKKVAWKAGTATVLSSVLTIENLTMNNAFGIYMDSSDITIKNSILDHCSPYSQHGIVNSENTQVEMSHCQIINSKGMGIFSKLSRFNLKHTLIQNNNGNGGLFIESPSVLTNCEIIGNNSDALVFRSASDWQTSFTSVIKNCLIVKNNGTGIKFEANNNAEIVNTTIADNTASSSWGGVSGGSIDTHLKNCIVWNNGSDLNYQAGGYYTYSVVQGNYYGQDTSTTNLDNINPLFREAGEDDYHLQSADCGDNGTSPAIDAGNPSIRDYVTDCASAGLGTKRSDIGAYGGADNRWDEDILPACHFAGDVSGVWECEEIYIDGDITIPAGDTLQITSSVEWVHITGPYQIKVKGVLLAIGPENDRTSVNGNYIEFQGAAAPGNRWHGIFFNNLNDSGVGASIIENCRFDYADKTDMTYQGGGAVAVYNSDMVTIKSSVFYANNAELGGALYVENSDIRIENCYFQSNGKDLGQNGETLTNGGGAMYIKNANPYLHKLTFINNQAQGGAAMVLDNSSPHIANILIAENIADGIAGGIQCINGSSPEIVNMTSTNNIAKTAGGTLYLNVDSNPTIINSIMYDNSKPEIYLDGATVTVTYSIIDSASNESYIGEGCLDIDPWFVAGVEYRLANNSCSFSDGSNVVSPAIDAGHPDSIDTYLDCSAGLGKVRADMGYYGGHYAYAPTEVGESAASELQPSHFELKQNYPNPFNPQTTISFSLPRSGQVALTIYNILGEEIGRLLNEKRPAGHQTVKFNGLRYSSGIYFYRITVKNHGQVTFRAIRKMMLLK